DTGENTLSITQELAPGTSLAAADEAARKVEDVIADFPAIETYQVTGGDADAAMAFFGGGSQTTYSITLDMAADAAAIEQELREELSQLTDVGDLSVATGMAGFMGSLEVVVSGVDGEAVNATATSV